MRLRGREKSPRVEMLPLMDVVFLLLVFFIYSMMAMAVHRGMALTLPVSGAAERESVSVLALTVRADGGLFVNKEPVSLENVAEVLKRRQISATDADAPETDMVEVQVFAEDSLPYQTLYRVLDALKAAGVRKISLQARQERAP